MKIIFKLSFANKISARPGKHLIKTVVNRYAPSGKLPMDVGVIVNNIDTCVAICNAIQKACPC